MQSGYSQMPLVVGRTLRSSSSSSLLAIINQKSIGSSRSLLARSFGTGRTWRGAGVGRSPSSSSSTLLQPYKSYRLFPQFNAIGGNQQHRGVFVIAEETPNPESLMFYPQGNTVLGNGTKTKQYSHKRDVKNCLIASALFKVHGVQAVMLAARHITITKDPDTDWEFVKPNVELVISQFYAAGLDPIDKSEIEYYAVPEPEESAKKKKSSVPGDAVSIEEEIKELLEERVKPFVQSDGGDVAFVKYEDNILYLEMQGACSGCPKSGVTLNIQIKQLIQHYFPDVKDVVEWFPEGSGDHTWNAETSMPK